MENIEPRAQQLIQDLSITGKVKSKQLIELSDRIQNDFRMVQTAENLLSLRVGLDPAAIVLKAAEDIAKHSIVGLLAGVLLLGAACAVVISTGMNYLLSPTTNIMRDIYGRFIEKGASEARKLALQKIFIVILGVCAFLMIFIPTVRGSNISVLRYAYTAYTMYGVAITPALLAALIWRRATKAGGLASIISGGLSALILELVIPMFLPQIMKGGDPWGIPGIYFSFTISMTCLIGVSLLTKAPTAEELQELFPVKTKF